jgi:1-acyl-sn-glycerol-3-phosphate acyltransferase
VSVRLDSSLECDVGVDSLALVELRERLERACGVQLPDDALAKMDTPLDWVHALSTARGARPPTPLPTPAPERVTPLEATAGPPTGAETLGDVVSWHEVARPHAVQVCLLNHTASVPPTELTYADLSRRGRTLAHSLIEKDVQPGQSVALMLPTGVDYFLTFFGVLLAGAVPVPIYPPFRAARLGEHLVRQAGILDDAQAVALVTVPQALPLARLLRARVPSLRAVATPGDLTRPAPSVTATLPPLRPDDVALLQYTSGSTGDPKGVLLTHRQLLANIRAMGAAAQVTATDRFVSWLPLYHDMGLIGAWLGSLYFGFPCIVMSPMQFLARPSRWLWAVHSHRGTLSAGPNFAFELCLRRIRDDEIAGLDLSCLRMMFNGAEPVSPDTVRRFTERFAGYGFRPEAMAPVYGLAEAAVGLAFPPPGRGPLVDSVDRKAFVRDRRAIPARAEDRNALHFVACGRPLPGYEIRVVDGAGRELPDRTEGRVEFTGPSATAGYHRAPEKTARLRRGAWLDTGDVGYIAEGDVYITGREKDLIIRAGRNLHPVELEEAVGHLPGVRPGCVAVFATAERVTGTERLVVLAETRESDPQRLGELRQRVVATTVDVLGTPPDDVALAPPGTVPKTSSGKIRRTMSRARYEAGLTGGSEGPVWWQLARFAGTGVRPQLRRWGREASALAYASYAWAVLVMIAVPTWLAVAVLPSRIWCWRLVQAAGNAARRLCATPLSVTGVYELRRLGPCVLVANHASYLDGLALLLALPGSVAFVAAAEFEPRLVSGTLLKRLGCEFVTRRGPREAIPEVSRLADVVRSGRSIVLFPEGSLSRAPGLRPFRLGAFKVAAAAGVPVVPVGIRGTRDILRPGHRFPRHGRVEVVFAAALVPTGRDWLTVVRLRDAVRQAVLVACGEHSAS